LGAELHNVEKQLKIASDLFSLLYQGRAHLVDPDARLRVKSNYKTGE
jgi:hypothetical protein